MKWRMNWKWNEIMNSKSNEIIIKNVKKKKKCEKKKKNVKKDQIQWIIEWNEIRVVIRVVPVARGAVDWDPWGPSSSSRSSPSSWAGRRDRGGSSRQRRDPSWRGNSDRSDWVCRPRRAGQETRRTRRGSGRWTCALAGCATRRPGPNGRWWRLDPGGLRRVCCSTGSPIHSPTASSPSSSLQSRRRPDPPKSIFIHNTFSILVLVSIVVIVVVVVVVFISGIAVSIVVIVVVPLVVSEVVSILGIVVSIVVVV